MRIKKLLSVLLALSLICSFGALLANAQTAPAGTVYISFEDYGVRAAWDDPEDLVYPEPLGMLINQTAFEIFEGETVADVVTRFLTEKGIGYTGTGSGTSIGGNFYLASLTQFTTDSGVYIERIGEYSSGAWSGWMVRVNNWFVSEPISEYLAEDGDIIRFMNSCQGGADVESDWSSPSAAITGIEMDEKYGTITPEFDGDTIDYTLWVPYDVEAVKVSVLLENYSAITSCIVSDGDADTVYKYQRDIPVAEGTTITFESSYYNYGETDPADIDCIVLTVEKETLEEYNERTGSGDDTSFIAELFARIRAFFEMIISFIQGLFA